MREISRTSLLVTFPFRKHEKQLETDRKQILPPYLLSRFADTNPKSSFAAHKLFAPSGKISSHGSKYFRLSFHGSTWQKPEEKRESGTSRFGCFSVSHFHIVCRSLYGNSSRRARLPRSNIEFERILMGACIIFLLCRQTAGSVRNASTFNDVYNVSIRLLQIRYAICHYTRGSTMKNQILFGTFLFFSKRRERNSPF